MAIYTIDQLLQKTGGTAKDIRPADPSAQPEPEAEKPGYLSRVATEYTERGQKLIGGFKAAERGEQSPVSAVLQGAGQIAAAAFTPVTQAIAPVIAPVVEKVSEQPAVQDLTSKYTSWKSQHPEAAANLEGAVNIAVLLSSVPVAGAAGKSASRAASAIAEAPVATIKKVGAAGSKAVRVAADPVSIMNRVARVTPTSAQKFTKLSGGESIGQYLTKRGVYGNVEDVTKQLYQRFTQTRTAADDGLANLKGSFQPKPVETALDALVAREARVSSPGALSRDFKRVRDLQNKFRREGLTMPEINEVKRLYERNVRLDYAKQNLTTEVAKATNLDSAMREWQMSKADEMGFKNLREINKETQLARELADALGKEYSGKLGNNAVSLTDWILIAGGDPAALASLGLKKVFSSKSVMSAIARKLGGEATVGVPTPSFGAAAKPGLREFMMDKRPVPYKRR